MEYRRAGVPARVLSTPIKQENDEMLNFFAKKMKKIVTPHVAIEQRNEMGYLHLMKTPLALACTLAAAVLAACASPEERMERELAESSARYASPHACYDSYVQWHGIHARKLREAAAKAATMRIHVYLPGSDISEYIPLTAAETKEVKEILAKVEAPPAHDYPVWLREEYDHEFGPNPSPPPYFHLLQFLSSGGKVLYEFEWENLDGDKALAETYRTEPHSPIHMVPTKELERWRALPCFQKARKRALELCRGAH